MKKITFSKNIYETFPENILPVVTSCFSGRAIIKSQIKHPLFDDLDLEELKNLEADVLFKYMEYLPWIALKLNKANNINKDLEYWHSAVGYWVNFVLQYVLIRAFIVRKVFNYFKNDPIHVLNVDLTFNQLSFCSTDDLVNQVNLDDQFSSFVYGKLIKSNLPNFWKVEDFEDVWSKDNSSLKPKRMNWIKFESFIGFYGLSKPMKFFFIFLNRFFYLIKGSRNKTKASSLAIVTEHLKNLNPPKHSLQIDFEYFLGLMMPSNFKHIDKIARPQINLLTPNLIDSGVRMHAQDSQSFYIADLHEKGRRIGFAQHGGLYGSAAVLTTHFLREMTYDAYLSWGWRECLSYHAKSIMNVSPYVYKFSKLRRKTQVKDKIIFVGTRLPAYVYSLYSIPMGERNLSLNETRFNFFKQLNSEILKRTYYKPYPLKNEDILDYCVQNQDELKLSILSGDAMKHVVDAKLVVVDHPVTVFLLCIAARIPFIGIWQEDEWPMTGEFQFFLNKLRRDGFIHSDSKDAADWISRNYSDIDLLFNNLDYLDEFSEKFSKVDKKWFFKLVSSVWKFNNI